MFVFELHLPSLRPYSKRSNPPDDSQRPISTMFHSLWLFALLVSCRIENAYAATRSYNFNLHSSSRAPGKYRARMPLNPAVEPGIDMQLDGFDRQVYLINNQQTGPLIEADEGDILEVVVQNDLDVENTIHWHGS